MNVLKQNSKLVTLIIPIYNEEKTLTDIVNRCASQKIVKQIILVNDGSSDNSKKILTKLNKDPYLKKKISLSVVHHHVNHGKGAAIMSGLAKATSKYIMVQDADLEYSPEEIKNLLNVAEVSKSGIVFGTRSYNHKKGYLLSRLGNLYLNIMFNTLFGYKLTDAYTCYKLMPRSIWNKLKLKRTGFEIDSEMIAKLGTFGYQIQEVRISYNPRKFSEGKKIKWIDLIKATQVALSIRLGISN